jgi:hypothetical protein
VQRGLALLGSLSLAASILWFGRGPPSTIGRDGSPPRDPPRVVAQKGGRAPSAVSTLLKQEASAYHAALFADEEGVVLVTQTGFALFPSGEPAELHSVPLGPLAVRQGGSIVFWRSGSVWQISLSGGDERHLAALPHAPRYLLASQSHVAWIELGDDTRASLKTISGGGVRAVYESEDKVCASVLLGAVVYWVLQSRDGSWKVGSVGLDGQHRRVTAAHQGRPPAMLAPGLDGVYFYDGPERGIRRLSFDLDREDAVSTQVICSPLAVSNRVVCAQVGGLFDIPPGGTAPRFLASEFDGPVTALVATDERVFWVAESGNDRLVVRSTLLP